jgi:hypothetical protein
MTASLRWQRHSTGNTAAAGSERRSRSKKPSNQITSAPARRTAGALLLVVTADDETYCITGDAVMRVENPGSRVAPGFAPRQRA